ncbi:MAG: hypothetical protein AB8U44_02455 [Aaplasma endosymbiont of Hyalomma asiaticum]
MQKNLSLIFEPLVIAHRRAASEEFMNSYRAKTKKICSDAHENLSSIYENIRSTYNRVRKATPNYGIYYRLCLVNSKFFSSLGIEDNCFNQALLGGALFFLLSFLMPITTVCIVQIGSIESCMFVYRVLRGDKRPESAGLLSYLLAWSSCLPMALLYAAAWVFHALEAVVYVIAHSCANTFSEKFFKALGDAVYAVYSRTVSCIMGIGHTEHAPAEKRTLTYSDHSDGQQCAVNEQAVPHETKGSQIRSIFAMVLGITLSYFSAALLMVYALAAALILRPLYLSAMCIAEFHTKKPSERVDSLPIESCSEKSSTHMEEVYVCEEQSLRQRLASEASL